MIDPLLAAGELPNLAAMAKRGITADVETVEPVNSPTVWTSIATGRSPDAHGVTDFLETAVSVQVPTIFERLAVQGRLSADGFSGTHRPIGILLAAGAPIQHLAEREKVSVLEVAPLLAYLAGAAIPEDLEGSFQEPWIRPEYLATHPAHHVGAADLPRLPGWKDTQPRGDNSELIERLRSMGYIE